MEEGFTVEQHTRPGWKMIWSSVYDFGKQEDRKKGGQTKKSATYMKLQELRFDFSHFQQYLRQGSDIFHCPSPEIS